MEEGNSPEQINTEVKEESFVQKQFCTVTPVSKTLAAVLFIALPFIGFGYGWYANVEIDKNYKAQKSAYVPVAEAETEIETAEDQNELAQCIRGSYKNVTDLNTNDWVQYGKTGFSNLPIAFQFPNTMNISYNEEKGAEVLTDSVSGLTTSISFNENVQSYSFNQEGDVVFYRYEPLSDSLWTVRNVNQRNKVQCQVDQLTTNNGNYVFVTSGSHKQWNTEMYHMVMHPKVEERRSKCWETSVISLRTEGPLYSMTQEETDAYFATISTIMETIERTRSNCKG